MFDDLHREIDYAFRELKGKQSKQLRELYESIEALILNPGGGGRGGGTPPILSTTPQSPTPPASPFASPFASAPAQAAAAPTLDQQDAFQAHTDQVTQLQQDLAAAEGDKTAIRPRRSMMRLRKLSC